MANEEQVLVEKIKALLARRYGDTSADSMRKLFDQYDRDGDQSIAAGELVKLLEDAGVGNSLTRGAWVKGVIGKLDSDADKTISWAEFSRAVGI